MRIKLLGALVLGVAVAAVGSAGAATITPFNTFASWSAAAGSPIINENFADTTLVPGLTITFGNNIPAGSISGGAYHDVAVTQFNDANNPKLGFSPATTAVGADWDFTPGGAGDGVILFITFSDASTGSFFIGNPAGAVFVGFSGFVSDTAVTSIRMDSPSTGVEAFDITDLWFKGTGNGGGGGTVPEPATLGLVGLALLGFWGTSRRKN